MDAWEDQHSREATESARKRADELGIDIAAVDGTGSNGRVTRDDVDAHAEKLRDGGDVQGDDSDPAEPLVPGASAPLPASVEPDESISGLSTRFAKAVGGSCVRFHCPTNPNFNLQSHKLGGTIRFTDGCYETDDPAEIAALRAQQCVEEVSNG